MNTPNKLTIARVIMIPFFVAFLMYDIAGDAGKWIALVIFIAASITDTLDGYIARKYHLVTNFGKFMDPLADKLLVCSALICFTATGKLAAWITIIILPIYMHSLCLYASVCINATIFFAVSFLSYCLVVSESEST